VLQRAFPTAEEEGDPGVICWDVETRDLSGAGLLLAPWARSLRCPDHCGEDRPVPGEPRSGGCSPPLLFTQPALRRGGPGAGSVWLSPRDSGVMTDLSSEQNQGTLYLPLCLKGPPFPPNKTGHTVHLAKALRLWLCVCLGIGPQGAAPREEAAGLARASWPPCARLGGLGWGPHETWCLPGERWAHRKGSETRSRPSQVQC